MATTQARAQQSGKPNIVVMLMDNLGYSELGIYGGGILRGAPTPNIDKLAGEGMRLLNFNVEAQCTPSRSALMTGRFSIRSGTYEVPIGGVPDGLTQWEITIAQLLSRQGYRIRPASGFKIAALADVGDVIRHLQQRLAISCRCKNLLSNGARDLVLGALRSAAFAFLKRCSASHRYLRLFYAPAAPDPALRRLTQASSGPILPRPSF